jgi:hypothetical protein
MKCGINEAVTGFHDIKEKKDPTTKTNYLEHAADREKTAVGISHRLFNYSPITDFWRTGA